MGVLSSLSKLEASCLGGLRVESWVVVALSNRFVCVFSFALFDSFL